MPQVDGEARGVELLPQAIGRGQLCHSLLSPLYSLLIKQRLDEPIGKTLPANASHRAIDGLEQRPLAKQVEIEGERVVGRQLLACPIKRPEIIIKPLQLIHVQLPQPFEM
ncbi:hypothetical protein EVA_13386 [gut metagenome]|uniref:Uncharacterized protein n=1 Tax=gut metagenome TaxID=749906 RepID=J9FVG2_9ZZZZ